MTFRTILLLTFLALIAWMELGRKPRMGMWCLAQGGLAGAEWRIDPLLVSAWSGCRTQVLAPRPKAIDKSGWPCFRKPCLLEVGRRYGMDLMLGGSVERFGDSLLVAWRLVEVDSGEDLRVRAEVLPFKEPEWRDAAMASLAGFLLATRDLQENATTRETFPSDRRSRDVADGRD